MPKYTDPKWKLYTLFLWITVLLVYMSLSDLRMLIETSLQITILQFLFKSQVYSSVNAWKTCSLRCTCWVTGDSLTALKSTRKHLQLSTDNKKQFIVTKRFHIVTARLSKDQRNQVICVLMAGSTVNDIAYILAALNRLFIILWTGTTKLVMSEFVQDLVAHVWRRYILITLTR